LGKQEIEGQTEEKESSPHLQEGDSGGSTMNGMLVGKGQRGVSSLAMLRNLTPDKRKFFVGLQQRSSRSTLLDLERISLFLRN